MPLKLISFSIFDESKRKEAVEYVKTFEHIEVVGGSFIVDTPQSIDLLRREIAFYMEKIDELIIVKIKKNEYISFHLGNRKKWIEERL